MRAVIIAGAGGPEVLEVRERPTPSPKPNEVLVRVYASALNRADLHQREGHYPAPPGAPEDIPGLEFAGEIAQLGSEVTGWREGDRVFGIVAGGGNAEYLTTDAGTIARIPDRLSWTEAAAVPEAFITAHDAMVTQAELQANENVLIHAVGSGVGLAAVQITRAWKAVPFGTARTPEKIDRARSIGLENGLVVSDDLEIIPATTDLWSAGKGMHVTMDLVCGPYLPISIRAAAPRGRIMMVGTVAGRTASISCGMILGKRLTLRGTVMRARSLEEKRAATEGFRRDVVPRLESGELVPTIDKVYDLSEIREAHERLASNATFGKVVLRVR
jgi:putative PIG3 family NAD(P)H quinone oxidoreductase